LAGVGEFDILFHRSGDRSTGRRHFLEYRDDSARIYLPQGFLIFVAILAAAAVSWLARFNATGKDARIQGAEYSPDSAPSATWMWFGLGRAR